MKLWAIGKSIGLRAVEVQDAKFILNLRLDAVKGQHLSATPNDLSSQKSFIDLTLRCNDQYYFIICDKISFHSLGTVRLYDFKGDSFCWGSWIVADGTPSSTALQSSLLIYDFAFFALHFKQAHFDVRKHNKKVVSFHKRMGAEIVKENDEDYFFEYTLESYLIARKKYLKFLP